TGDGESRRKYWRHGKPRKKNHGTGSRGFFRAKHEKRCHSHGDRGGESHFDGWHANENGRDANAAHEQAERKSERENVQRAAFGNALCDQMAWEPVPHANLAGDIEKE